MNSGWKAIATDTAARDEARMPGGGYQESGRRYFVFHDSRTGEFYSPLMSSLLGFCADLTTKN